MGAIEYIASAPGAWKDYSLPIKSKGHRTVSKRLNVRPVSKRLRAAGSFSNSTSKNGDRTLQKRQSDLHFLF